MSSTPDDLSNEEVRRWLCFQRCFSLRPEEVRDALVGGKSPESLLAHDRMHRVLSGRDGKSRSKESAERTAASEAAKDEQGRDRLARLGGQLLPLGMPGYPSLLAELPDAPGVLLVRGQIEALGRPSIAIVGARAATRAARSHARNLARDLAACGLAIVSGLARGIDAEAHRGAIEAGGATVGVLAGGVDQMYPPEHRDLAEELCEKGAVLGEMPLGTAPRRELFPLRNRIISGLCVGVIVIEARARSGSLITVRHALSQGREVFVVPGASEGPFAAGSNRLLRDGARAVASAEDVLEDLGGLAGLLPVRAVQRRQRGGEDDCDEEMAEGEAQDPESALLSRLSSGPATRDQLLQDMTLTPGQLAAVLVDAELRGRIVEERDGRFHRCFHRRIE